MDGGGNPAASVALKGRTGDLLTSLNLNWRRFLCRGALSVMCEPFVLLDQVEKIISVNRLSFWHLNEVELQIVSLNFPQSHSP